MSMKEITDLIDLALADGKLDESERRHIESRAVAMGLDSNTLLNLIDERKRLFGKSFTENQAVRRCPNCKAQIDDELLTVCTYCNASLSQAVASNELAEFHRRLMAADGTKKVEMIKSYPSPTAKNDIVAFLSLAVPAYTTYSQNHRGILPIGAFMRFIGAQSKQDESAYYEATAWKIKAMSTMSNASILHAADPAFISMLQAFQSKMDAEARADRKSKIIGMTIALAAPILYYLTTREFDLGYALRSASYDMEELFEFEEPFVFLIWGVVFYSVYRAIKLRSRE